MLLANFAFHALSHVPTAAAWVFQEPTIGWDPVSLWRQMGILAKIVVVILFIMSGWSIGVMIDRAMAFSAARKQSRAFAPAVAGALREGKIDEAIKVAERNKKSHLAKVVTAGLQEFKAHGDSTDIPGEQIEASKRALERAEAIVHAELKRGLGGLATIGSTAPFVGLFGTVVGILNAFKEISSQKATGLGAVAGGISEALVTTAIGLFVAIPAVMMFNYFTGKVEAFDVEMDNSSSELIDYFLKAVRFAGKGSLEEVERMALALRNEGSKVNSNINVTPMVDVMLVLLIIFMVITPMLQKGQSVDMAKVNNPTPMPDADKEDALLVVVMRDGQIFFGTDRIRMDELTNKVKDRLNNKPDKRIFIRADMRAKYGYVVDVVDNVRAAGVDDVGLLTEQKHAGPGQNQPPPANPGATAGAGTE